MRVLSMYKFCAIAIVLLLSACSAVFPNKVVDTRDWKAADCSGAAGWAACFKKAESHCPGGYDIAKQEENMVTGLRTFEFSCRN